MGAEWKGVGEYDYVLADKPGVDEMTELERVRNRVRSPENLKVTSHNS